MSLNDVDKGSVGRANPDLNADDVLRSQKGRATSDNTVLPSDTTKEFQNQTSSLVIIDEQLVSITLTGDSYEVFTYPHGLDYVPVVMGFINDSIVMQPLPAWTASSNFSTGGQTFVGFQQWISIAADSVNVYIQVNNALANTLTYPIRYYIFQRVAT
jgi:hypothetical protein